MSYSLNALYRVVGVSKQAVHQYDRRDSEFQRRMLQLMTEADELRQEHPGCGLRKMYHSLNPDFIGRDRFEEIMMDLGYRLKRKKNYRKTTIASTRYFPNLIQGMLIDGASQVWQSDITYIPIADRHYYATFIIDVYTKKIVGYHVTDHMRATANVKALKMALKLHAAPRIHHSDRGSQYTYGEYLKLLKESGSKISMAKTAQDNAYAERINKTIKEEYLDYWKPKNLSQLKVMVRKAVNHYNTRRQHDHLGRKSPSDFEKQRLNNRITKTITIFNHQLVTKNGQH